MTNLLRQHFMKCAMLLCALFTAITISAVPAKPGLKRIITLANGTQVEAMLVGDEYGHYWLANDGKAYVETTTTGLYTPANLSTLSPRRETSQTWTCPSGRDIGWGAQHKQLDVSPSRLSSLSRSFPSFSLQMLGKETRREKHYFPPETKTNTLRVEDST